MLQSAYDYMGRRIMRTTKNQQQGTTNHTQYVYDGWNLLSEISYSPSDSQTNTRWFVWGLDLSGTLQGAGGVGGLLLVTKNDEQGTRNYVPAYDANGNVTEYISDDGTIVARYEYDPFGNITRAEGPKHADFPYRFSTKYTADETGLVYYGYRFYNPQMGRWINRDPIEEKGGINLFEFSKNDPLNKIDIKGLMARVSAKCCRNYDPKDPCKGACEHSDIKNSWSTFRVDTFGVSLCYHGEKCFCTNPNKASEYGDRVMVCVEAHERDHLSHPDVDCGRSTIDPCSPNVGIFPPGKAPNRNCFECSAYRVERECLEKISNLTEEEERLANVKISEERACGACP